MPKIRLTPNIPLPTVFEYKELQFFFYSHEHTPVHIHVRADGCESKAIFIFEKGNLLKIKIAEAKNKKPLTGIRRKDMEEFLAKYALSITQKWIDYFIYHKPLGREVIENF